jgi:hypothetical protein
MSNKTNFFNSKLIYNLKLNKLIIVSLLVILLIIIFFVNYDSLFKIIEGNRSCMFNQEQMEKDVERKAKKYERDNPNTNDTQSTLARVSGLDVDINAKV